MRLLRAVTPQLERQAFVFGVESNESTILNNCEGNDVLALKSIELDRT